MPVNPKTQSVTDQLVEEIRERERRGYQTYGGPLLAHNGRSSPQDLLEELLDAAQYAMQWRIERQDLIAALDDMLRKHSHKADGYMCRCDACRRAIDLIEGCH